MARRCIAARHISALSQEHAFPSCCSKKLCSKNTGQNSLLFSRSPLEYLADHQRIASVVNLLQRNRIRSLAYSRSMWDGQRRRFDLEDAAYAAHYANPKACIRLLLKDTIKRAQGQRAHARVSKCPHITAEAALQASRR